MRFALVDGNRTEPLSGLAGHCPVCDREMTPKCGRYVRWHWAHKRRSGCDPWHEPETEWHLMWKDCFPKNNQEVVHIDNGTGERHIADVKSASGLVVEVQHSPIAQRELLSREAFYGDMIWIVDARDLAGYFSLGTSHDLATFSPMSYHFRWFSRSSLLKRWSVARKPVYFDIYIPNALTANVKAPSRQLVLWRLFGFDLAKDQGFIAPVGSDALVEAVVNGDPLPLHRCEERDAWRYRRNFAGFPLRSKPKH